MCAALRTLRYGKHLWQFSLNDCLHSFLNLKMKQTKTPKKKLAHLRCKNLTRNVKQRSQNSRTKKKTNTKKGARQRKVPRFLHRSLPTQTYFRSSLFLLPGGAKGRPEIHLHSQATYTEVNLKNSYLMYVCRQLLHHPEGESEGLSLN